MIVTRAVPPVGVNARLLPLSVTVIEIGLDPSFAYVCDPNTWKAVAPFTPLVTMVPAVVPVLSPQLISAVKSLGLPKMIGGTASL